MTVLLLYFIWDVEHDRAIRKIFDLRMGRRLQQMLDDVHHGKEQRTGWLRREVKKGLLAHWETNVGSKHRRLTNRANRASARSSKYTGGSATFMKTKARVLKSLDREVTLTETFKYTHTLKENKARFVDHQRSQDHYSLKVATQQSQQSGGENAADGSVASVVDPDATWREPTSAPYKNHVYGISSFFASSLHTSTLRPLLGSATSRAIQPEEGVDLRLQVQELQHSLHQQA
ncbi:hypothetical protein Ahy_B02g061262 [Arachis hypogaea]|uniref:Uncharacterized protein n=1 Tax=Arachis hypogaea TaxID=3818 RepID=A0A445AKK1_ARAHY|nr:hypothetical protein Ahy_B02g061262 [Arachis hypogaea]